MTSHERLRLALDRYEEQLRATVPGDRGRAIAALVHAIDQQAAATNGATADLVTGRQLANLGGNLSIWLCLAAEGDRAEVADSWGERFLADASRLAEGRLVLGHTETGFMRLADDGASSFDAWIATKLPPASWRERTDIDWWAGWLARRHTPRGVDRPALDANQRAGLLIDQMGYQLNYPPDATIDGITIRTYQTVLRWLISRALAAHERGELPAPQSERELVTAMTAAIRIDPATAARAVAAFTVDVENAGYHAAVPGVAAAPVVRVDDSLILSAFGLTTEPLFFLTRELRRRAAQDYHNNAYLREEAFRHDLYALFADKRFVTSSNRIELRRAKGDVRTDIDAIIFDRKTGTLGFFELKSQNPFARSTAELIRQRDNLLYANRQVSGVLDWLNRNGGNELLNRVDQRVARQFRVQKVYPFVLGRYLAHFNDGPEPDRRAAWGTWPQVLRLLDGQPVTGSNPIASLHSRLTKDQPAISGQIDAPARAITLGDALLVVHPSHAAYQQRAVTR